MCAAFKHMAHKPIKMHDLQADDRYIIGKDEHFIEVAVCDLFLFDLCSFCLKGETLDGKSPAVIDYTPYLKFTQR